MSAHEGVPIDDQSVAVDVEKKWGGIQLPDPPSSDAQLGILNPQELLTDKEKLQLDLDIVRIKRHVREARGNARFKSLD